MIKPQATRLTAFQALSIELGQYTDAETGFQHLEARYYDLAALDDRSHRLRPARPCAGKGSSRSPQMSQIGSAMGLVTPEASDSPVYLYFAALG